MQELILWEELSNACCSLRSQDLTLTMLAMGDSHPMPTVVQQWTYNSKCGLPFLCVSHGTDLSHLNPWDTYAILLLLGPF